MFITAIHYPQSAILTILMSHFELLFGTATIWGGGIGNIWNPGATAQVAERQYGACVHFTADK